MLKFHGCEHGCGERPSTIINVWQVIPSHKVLFCSTRQTWMQMSKSWGWWMAVRHSYEIMVRIVCEARCFGSEIFFQAASQGIISGILNVVWIIQWFKNKTHVASTVVMRPTILPQCCLMSGAIRPQMLSVWGFVRLWIMTWNHGISLSFKMFGYSKMIVVAVCWSHFAFHLDSFWLIP